MLSYLSMSILKVDMYLYFGAEKIKIQGNSATFSTEPNVVPETVISCVFWLKLN